MLAKLSQTARVGRVARMFCKPAHGVNSPFLSHRNLDPLLKQIDGDRPMLYCLLVTESWHPEAIEDLAEVKGMLQGIEVYHACSDVDQRINRYYTIRAHPAFFIGLYGRHITTHYGLDLRKLSEKIKGTMEYASSGDLVEGSKTYKSLHADFRQTHQDYHAEHAWMYN